MITSIRINKVHNLVTFNHYGFSKQYAMTLYEIKWLETKLIRDNWKHAPNGHTYDKSLGKYVPITVSNDPYPFYTKPNLRFEQITVNWTDKTITFLNLDGSWHDKCYKVSTKRLKAVCKLLDRDNRYKRDDSEITRFSHNYHKRKTYKYTCYCIR